MMDIDLKIQPMTKMKDLNAEQRKAVQLVGRSQAEQGASIWKPTTPEEQRALAIVQEWMLDLPVYMERQRIATGRKK